MAYRRWPDNIDSAPLRSSYQEGVGNRLKRSEAEAGPAKVRLSPGVMPAPMSCEWVFETWEKLQEFEFWVADVASGLAGGVLAFDWQHPVSKEWLTMRFVPVSDTALYTKQNIAAWAWKVTASLEVLP